MKASEKPPQLFATYVGPVVCLLELFTEDRQLYLFCLTAKFCQLYGVKKFFGCFTMPCPLKNPPSVLSIMSAKRARNERNAVSSRIKHLWILEIQPRCLYHFPKGLVSVRNTDRMFDLGE